MGPAHQIIRKWFSVAILLLPMLLLAGCDAQLPDRGALTRLRDVANAAMDSTQFGRPVQFTATVLVYDAEWDVLFLHQDTTSFYIRITGDEHQLESGDRVRVTGRVADHTRGIEDPDFEVLGRDPLPPATPRDLSDLISEKELGWSSVTGYVGTSGRTGNRRFLLLRDGEQEARVVIQDDRIGGFDWFVGARVRAVGLPIRLAGTDERSLLAPSLREVEVLQPPTDPMSKPVRQIGWIHSLTEATTPSQRIHLRGMVVEQDVGEALTIRDRTGEVTVRSDQLLPVQKGDTVSVSALVTWTNRGPVLDPAYYEQAKPTTKTTHRTKSSKTGKLYSRPTSHIKSPPTGS